MGTLLKDKIFAEVNNDTNDMTWQLIKNYGKVTFQGDKRTLWYNGKPYGTSYYKLDSTGNLVSNPEVTDKTRDVFGSIRDHEIQDSTNNVVVMGDHNQASISNSLALGKYNKSTGIVNGETKNYIFTIGNGITPDKRSNLMQVDDKGDLTTYSISYTKLDTSYVSSLGKDATMNVVMQALLTPAEYYAPRPQDFSLSFSGVGSSTNIVQGETIHEVKLNCTWKSRKPKWYQPYIDNYVQTNTSLPSGASLDDLIYTNCLGKGLNVTSDYDTTVSLKDNPNNIHIRIQSQNTNDSTQTIYNGSNSFALKLTYNTTTEITKVNVGKYVICPGGDVTIDYGESQQTFFRQLAEQNVYVKSTSKHFNKGQVTLTIPSLEYYVGVNIYTGIYVSTANKQDSTGVLNLIEDSQYKGTTIFTGNSNHFNFNTKGIGRIGTTRNDFSGVGENLKNEQYKYIWIAIPTHYLNDPHTDNTNYQHWNIQQINTANINTFATLSDDPCNYKFTKDEYTYIIAKTTGNIGVLTSTANKASDGDSLTITDIGIKKYSEFTTPR